MTGKRLGYTECRQLVFTGLQQLMLISPSLSLHHFPAYETARTEILRDIVGLRRSFYDGELEDGRYFFKDGIFSRSLVLPRLSSSGSLLNVCFGLTQ